LSWEDEARGVADRTHGEVRALFYHGEPFLLQGMHH
jgi:hypothetical protein